MMCDQMELAKAEITYSNYIILQFFMTLVSWSLFLLIRKLPYNKHYTYNTHYKLPYNKQTYIFDNELIR